MQTEMVDVQAEAGVIATILIHPEFLYTVRNLKPKYFYDLSNGCILWAVQELLSNGVKNIDAMNITNMLGSNLSVRKKMGECDIQEYIELSQYSARDTVEEFQLLVDTVITMAFKRDLYKMSVELGRRCQNEEQSLDDLNTFVNTKISDMGDQYIIGEDTTQFGEKVDKLWDNIVSKRNKDGSFGIPPLLPALEPYYTYVPGELVLVAGGTGKGKSSLFLNEALHKIQMGIGVLYIDTELSDEVFFLRSLSHLSGIEYARIQRGSYGEREAEKIEYAKDILRKSNLIHQYMPEFNKTKVQQTVRKWQLQSEIGLVIFDYIKPHVTLGAAETSNNLGQITDFLKNVIAGELDIPVIAGIQLNVVTNMIADSQKPLRYCSTYLVWRPKTKEELAKDGLDCGNFAIEIQKNRNGMSTDEDDYIDVKFDGDHMRIAQAPAHKKDEPFACR